MTSDKPNPPETVSLKVSLNAAKQLYPGVTSTACQEHGNQQAKRVPQHLKVLLDAEWACEKCVSDAKDAYEILKKEQRRVKAEEKASKKEEASQTLESAKAADVSLAEKVEACQNASEQLNKAKEDVELAREAVHRFKEELAHTDEALMSLKKQRDAVFERLLQQDRVLAEDMDSLDSAYNVVDSCYTDLRETLEKADNLWAGLSKNVRKKRDRTNRKAADDLLAETAVVEVSNA